MESTSHTAPASLYLSDAEDLIQALMPLSRTMLVRFREFLPYGGLLTAEGELIPLFASPEGDPGPAQELITELAAQCRLEIRGRFCSAAAVCWRVIARLPDSKHESSCIAFHIETRDGFAARVFYPFYFSPFRGLVVEKPFARKAQGLVFVPAQIGQQPDEE